MEFPEKISARVTAAIAEQLTDFSEEKLAEINYGIAIFIANSYKMLIIFLIALLLNVFKYFLIALVSFSLLRSFASGVHAKKEWTCLPASIILFFGIIYLGMNVNLSIYSLNLIFALCFAAMLKYAPADTEERPIVSTKLLRKLKFLSCIALLFLYAISLYYISTPISSLIAFSALTESAMIIPVTYKLTGALYGTGIKINKKMEVWK